MPSRASALAFAEHACLEYGGTPGTQTFERCVVSAAEAFDRGEPDIAYAEARVARAAGKRARYPARHHIAIDGGACADGLTKH